MGWTATRAVERYTKGSISVVSVHTRRGPQEVSGGPGVPAGLPALFD